jgi:hypothetical protein
VRVRWVLLLGLAFAAIWFGFVENSWLDPRPVQRVLFIGHSRTYYNNMPAMVAKMADSAGSDVRYEVTMQAFAGATAEDHWHNAKTEALLARGNWDRVILQLDAVLPKDEPDSSGLFVYGSQLIAKAATKSQPAIISDWTFRDPFYEKYSWNRADHFQKTELHYQGLAQQAGAQLIDVARVWEEVRSQDLTFSLYKDDDHPSLEGSYLVALVVYSALSGMDPTAVTYVPWGMSKKDAAHLKQRVKTTLANGS